MISEVAYATLWGGEIRGIDGSVAVPVLRACCLCLGLLWRRHASRGAVSLGLLGAVVLVSSGASLQLWPNVPAPSQAPSGDP